LYLQKITLILIFATVFSFSVRIFGTVFPFIFRNIFMVKGTILLNIFFILSHLLFWLFFYKEYASTKKPVLKKVCILAIIGSLAVSFLYMKKLPFVFGMNVIFPLFLLNPYIDAFVPLISALFHLIFFVSFRNSMDLEEERMLSRPTLSIIVGISFFIILHMVVLVNFMATHKFQWVEHMPQVVSIGTVPLIALAVFLMLIFYYRFYSFLVQVRA
jgi:hypothetical protein